MMTANDQSKTVALPEGLRHQFSALERRLWRSETLTGVNLALGSLLLSCFLLFVSDRLWETPPWLRIGLAAAGWAGLAWCALTWLKWWVFRRRDQRALAMLVQRRFRRLGDRLLGIVELANEKERPSYFSPDLYRAAIAQVAQDARQYDFPAAVSRTPSRRAAFALGGILFLAALPILLSPAAAWNAALRWAAPAARIERFTLVALEGLPAELIVAHGEPFALTGRVRYRSFWRPGRAVAQMERQPRILTVREREEVQVRVPGQVEPGVLALRLGDARQRIRITPAHRPSLKELHATVQLPDYLQYPPAQHNLETGTLRMLEGSKVQFQGKVSRTLAAAHVQLADQQLHPLQVEDDRFTSEPLDLEGLTAVAFTWRDPLGLQNTAPWPLQIDAQKDSPPTPELPDLLRDSAMLESEVLDIKMAARDDYGVRELGLNWQLLTEPTGEQTPTPRPFQQAAPNAQSRTFEEVFPFSPAVLGIPGDSIVELRGFATDYLPGREPSRTVVYRVHILGNARHAEMVRQSLESLLSHLEEVTRLEEKVLADTRELERMTPEQLEEASERIAAAQQEQAENAKHLEQMAQEGTKTLREAFRNPTFSEETLREWVKNLQDMRELSEGQMQQAADALQRARQQQESRSENLAQARQKEQETLEALEDLQRRINKGLDDLQALTLAQRLRKIAGDEKGIAGRLQRIIPEVIGMFPNELAPHFRQAQSAMAADQDSAQKETAELQGEIGRFFERTQKENYGQVNQEMTDSRIAEELLRVRGLIEENVSMDAMQTMLAWSDRLNGWADLLEPKSDSSGGGGGGGEGSSPDEALLKELLGLLRAREREVNLRRQTVLLERQKPEATAYEQAAKALAATQEQVRETVSTIQGENPVPALEFPLQDIIDAMAGVEELLHKPQTDRETHLAQTKAIELLSDVINLINEQQQRASSSSQQQRASAEEMAFLMQMMRLQSSFGPGQGTNPQGGGNPAGGTTDRAAAAGVGDPAGKMGEDRGVPRASGSTAPAPVEFRDALDNYYRALEALEAE